MSEHFDRITKYISDLLRADSFYDRIAAILKKFS